MCGEAAVGALVTVGQRHRQRVLGVFAGPGEPTDRLQPPRVAPRTHQRVRQLTDGTGGNTWQAVCWVTVGQLGTTDTMTHEKT